MKNFIYICKEYWRSLTAAIVLSILFWLASAAVSKASLALGMSGSSALVNFLERGNGLFLNCFFAELVLLFLWPTIARYFTKARKPNPDEDPALQKATEESWVSGFLVLTPKERFYFCNAVLLMLLLIAAISH